MVVTKGKKRAGAGRERSSEPSAAMACGGAASDARERESERERELRGANGSGGGGERDRGHLVADQGVSTPSHARHAAAEPCRRATASQRAPSARGRGRERGEGGGESAGGPSRLRPVGQKRGRGLLAPPFPFSNFFLNFFSPNSF